MRGTFHRLNGDHAEAEFMRSGLTWLDVACMDGFKVLKLPYKRGAAPLVRAAESGGGQPASTGHLKRRRGQVAAKSKATAPLTEVNAGTQYFMFFFLPDARDGLSTMADMVTASPSFLYGILAEMKERPVMLELPKFATSGGWASRCLSRRKSPIDLRGMWKGDDGDEVVAGAARRPTFLSKVAHTAVVKVNEVGTEAAAVTVHLCGGGGPPPDLVEFTVDHPFTFFIMEERSGVIVFAGHVLDPTK
ncbi:unnamed protein product [Miscanthus lutarioriparius]|uniref:Serpin domain-containing protein n=1 Tax=Miscanthus lutarioriparius TaxID=422564 RepID=A0A811SUA3_9POAL|nr:unnamed protein product [Miscanthus lutarioriparius]